MKRAAEKSRRVSTFKVTATIITNNPPGPGFLMNGYGAGRSRPYKISRQLTCAGLSEAVGLGRSTDLRAPRESIQISGAGRGGEGLSRTVCHPGDHGLVAALRTKSLEAAQFWRTELLKKPDLILDKVSPRLLQGRSYLQWSCRQDTQQTASHRYPSTTHKPLPPKPPRNFKSAGRLSSPILCSSPIKPSSSNDCGSA